MALTRDQILKADDLQRVEVPVPEWGGTVWVRTMTGQEREAYESSFIGRDGKVDLRTGMKDARARLCSLCVVDDAGRSLFTHADIEALSKKSTIAIGRVFDAIQKLNAITDEEIEELAGN